MLTTPRLKPSLSSIIILFALSFFVTAIFSASLKVFFASESWRAVLVKGIIIPCFTWTVQLFLSAIYMNRERRTTYWMQLGYVCLIGSVALLPAAFYNLMATNASPVVPVINVLLSVCLMGVLLYLRLRSHGFKARWAMGWLVLISINMLLYLSSIRH